MSDVSELFWKASLDEIERGYSHQDDADAYVCLICGRSFALGVIHPIDGTLFEARKAVETHIRDGHGSVFEFLLSLDNKLTGLTDHQKSLLSLFYGGKTDSEAAKALGTGSTSTIRNHRFQFRERQKQAKLFLALMELLPEKTRGQSGFISIPRTARQVDERYAITERENADILATYFKEGLNGPLSSLPIKEKRRIVILRHLVTFFETGNRYTEKQVNEVLGRFHPDHAMLRRNLIEYGFMDRAPDGSSYWVKLV